MNTPGGTRAAARAARVEEILRLARQRMLETGIADFDMAWIARQLKLSTPAIYRYFDSRDDLVAAVVGDSLRRLRAHVAARTVAWESELIRRRVTPEVHRLAVLLAQADLYLDLPRAMPSDQVVLAFAAGDPRVLLGASSLAPLAAAFDGVLADLAETFQRAEHVRALAPGSARRRAGLYWASLHGVQQSVKLVRLSPETLGDPRGLREIGPTLLRGWGAPERPLARADALVTPLREL